MHQTFGVEGTHDSIREHAASEPFIRRQLQQGLTEKTALITDTDKQDVLKQPDVGQTSPSQTAKRGSAFKQ